MFSNIHCTKHHFTIKVILQAAFHGVFAAVWSVFGKEKMFRCCIICLRKGKIASLQYDLSLKKNFFVAVWFVFKREKLFRCWMICLWRKKLFRCRMNCLQKGKALSLLYDMSKTLQNFTLPRNLQMAPLSNLWQLVELYTITSTNKRSKVLCAKMDRMLNCWY